MKHILLYCFLLYFSIEAIANPPVITQQPADLVLDCSTPGVLDSLSTWYQKAGGAMAEENGDPVGLIGEVPFPAVIDIFENSIGTLCGDGREVGLSFIATGSMGEQVRTDTAYFRVIDMKKPKIVTPTQQVLIPCSETARDSFINWIQAHGNAVAEDACTELTWTNFVWNDSQGNSGTSSINSGPYPQFLDDCTYFYNISFVVEDECGNESASPGKFTIVDGGAPVLDSLPQDLTVTCGNIPSPAMVNATDFCDPDPSLVVQIESTQSGDEDSCDYFNYEIFYDYVTADGCGNTFTHRQTISVRDTLAVKINATDTVYTACQELDVDTLYGEFLEVCNPYEFSFEDELMDNNPCRTQILRTHYFEDACNNLDTFAQYIFYQDETPPVLNVEPKDTTVFCEEDYEQAYANWLDEMVGLDVEDNCSGTQIYTFQGGDYDADSLELGVELPSFDDTNFCKASGNQLIFEQAIDFAFVDDCGNATVYTKSFFIRDTVPPTILDCPDSIAAVDFGAECSGSIVVPRLTVEDPCNGFNASSGVNQQIRFRSVFYQFMDADEIVIDNIPGGTYTLQYIIQDCAGNITTCETTVELEDDIPASIVGCPEDDAIIGSDCSVDYNLPVDILVDDDCPIGVPVVATLPMPGNRLLSYNSIDTQFFINNKSYLFENLTPVMFSTYPVQVQFNILAPEGLSFNIQGENGFDVGGGTIEESCTWQTFDYQVDAATYNDWLSDNELAFSFITESVAVTPCDMVVNGSDSMTQAYFTITHYRPSVGYSVSGATNLDIINLNPEGDNLVALNVGRNEITYIVNQGEVSADSCSFIVDVSENVDPEVACRNTILYTWPSVEDVDTLSVADIDDESSDNCGIDTMYLSQNNFDCTLYGSEVEVYLYVQDESGNIDSCLSRVRVEPETIEPTFTSGICESDTLRLFANVPLINNEDPFTYEWQGPNSFSSTEKNPIIVSSGTLSNDGTYTLTVKGFGGCSATGQVQVATEALVTPEVMIERDTVCSGTDVLLTSTAYAGDVVYKWYEGQFPNGALLATTAINSVVLSPVAGSHNYYLIVEGETCESNPSAVLTILAIEPPEVTVNESFINVCEGDDFTLGTVSFGPGYEYNWYGPNGYTANRPNPPAITDVTLEDGGRYFLLVNVGDCVSDTVSTRVNVFEKPDRPMITGEEVFCENATMTLSVNNITQGDRYRWYLDGALFTTTTGNSLNISNAQASFSGSWTVEVEEGICTSELSPIKEILVNDLAEVSATNTGPACEGDEVQLFATFVANATYLWTGPEGFTSTQQNPVISAVPGEYIVEVITTMDCIITASTTVTVGNAPTITALSSDAEQCMRPNEVITFFPTIVPPSGDYNYAWTGPDGFTSDQKNPTISQLTGDKVGTYTLRVSEGNCQSAVFEVEVDFLVIPEKPEITLTGNVCAGAEVTISTPDIVDSYTFYTPSGIIQQDNPILTLENISFSSDGLYAVALNNGVCQSEFSDTLTLKVNPVPEIPDVITNSPLCPGDTLFAYVPTDQDYNYEWYLGDSLYSVTAQVSIPDLSDEDLEDISLIVSSGDCSADPYFLEGITFTDALTTPALDQGSYDICVGGAEASVCISESTALPNTRYVMYNSFSDEVLIESEDPCFTMEELSSLQSGGYIVYFVAVRDNCTSDKSEDYAINLSLVPELTAEILDTETDYCRNEEIVLTSRFGEPEVLLEWVTTGGLEIINESGRAASFLASSPGNYDISLAYSTDGCPDFSSTSFSINIGESPVVNDEFYMLSVNETIEIDILENDDLPDDFTFEVVKAPSSGIITGLGGSQTYEPEAPGTFTLIYEVCGVTCSDCATGTTTFIVTSVTDDCKPPSIITPNDDGVNDYFVIPCLVDEQVAGKLIIFNEWGQEVYSHDAYDNSWSGTHNGKDLPVGTYYYILEVDNGVQDFNGFLLIQR